MQDDENNENKSERKLEFPKETMLELVQINDGEVVLKPTNTDDDTESEKEPLVTIQFSEQLQEMLGDDLKNIGQHMIHSAIQLLMHKQVASWHAKVVDEEPSHYS